MAKTVYDINCDFLNPTNGTINSGIIPNNDLEECTPLLIKILPPQEGDGETKPNIEEQRCLSFFRSSKYSAEI